MPGTTGRRTASGLSVLALLLWLCFAAKAVPNSAATAEEIEEVELITAPKAGHEFVALHAPSDLKKSPAGSKSKKIYQTAKIDSEWTRKDPLGKVITEVPIKEAKDNRLLRLISEGLLTAQDTLPTSAGQTESSQAAEPDQPLKVNVQPEGMTGIVNSSPPFDADEKKIMEKKKESVSTTTENVIHDRFPSSSSNEDDDESIRNVKINFDANVGIQNPNFPKEQGAIAVPTQKHISSSKARESIDSKNAIPIQEQKTFDFIPVNKLYLRSPKDDGSYDFVDTSLSERQLVPSGTSQTSRINVKKGPNGQDYEYEYIYYYYDDDGDENNASATDQSGRNNSGAETARPSSTSTTAIPTFAKTTQKAATNTFSNADSTVKSSQRTTIPSHGDHSDQARYTGVDAQVISKHQSNSYQEQLSNELPYQSPQPQQTGSRSSGRQIQLQAGAAPSSSVNAVTSDERLPSNTRFPPRGRSSSISISTENVASYSAPSSIPTIQSKDVSSPPKPKATSGPLRQPGLELVDSNSFRTYTSNNPPQVNYEKIPNQPSQKFAVETTQTELQKASPPTKSTPEILNTYKSTTKEEDEEEYITEVEYTAPTASSKTPTPVSQSVDSVYSDGTTPVSTVFENLITTMYNTGLTDKAAHDLYAIVQQTQNEESLTTAIQDIQTGHGNEDSSQDAYPATPSQAVTTVLLSTQTTSPTTTTTATTTTTTTTTTPPPPPPLTVPVAVNTGKGRYRGNIANRNKLTQNSINTDSSIVSSSEASSTETTVKSRPKFQPTHHRMNGERVSAYAKRAQSTTEQALQATREHEPEPTRSHSFGSARNKYRNRESTTEAQPQQTSSTEAHIKPNFAERYNTRQRGRQRTSTTTASSVESENTENKNEDQESAEPSSTPKSLRSKFNNGNSQVRPLRPGPRLNLSPRGRFSTSTTAPRSIPDADVSGSADVPIEQKQEDDDEETGETTIYSSSPSTTTTTTTTTTTPTPDTLTRLKNRPKLRVQEKSPKQNNQQANTAASSATLNQNRRNLVSNLLPKRRQQQQQQVNNDEQDQDNKSGEENAEEHSPRQEESQSLADALEVQPSSEASSTTTERVSPLLASRRRNLTSRKPGSLLYPSNRASSSVPTQDDSR